MLLLIDTSQETATVTFSKEGKVLFSEENKISKEHASWLHVAIRRMLTEADITLADLKAIAVIAGPGSYTGLRVGMAAAKGFCYALNIPLITKNTLEVMAESMRSVAEKMNALICPMIDARRDEVFTALYSTVIGHRSSVIDLKELLPPHAQILDKNSFETSLAENTIIFFGSGAEKWKKMTESTSAIFEPQPNIIQAFAKLAYQDFTAGKWADTVYSEPIYLKEFFTY